MTNQLGKHLFTFAVIADSHVNQEENETYSPYECNAFANARSRYAISLLNTLNPDFCIHLGDLVHPVPSLKSYEDAIKRFKNLFEVFNGEIHYLPGNHDVGDKPLDWMPAGTVTENNVLKFRNLIGKDYYSFNHSDVHFILINSQLFNTDFVSEKQQKEWLESDLVRYRSKRLMLFSHYPPYTADPDERGHYDNLDEPARSWLLDLCKKYQIEALYAGHVHNFFYDRFGVTDIYILPSICFVRQDYSEMFRIASYNEYGRNDEPKLGFFLVKVYENGHINEFIRTSGNTLLIDQPNLKKIQRVSTLSIKEKNHVPVGIDLRYNWNERTQIPPSGSLDEFDRKIARNDYPIMTIWEMGVRRLRVPLHEVEDDYTYKRMKVLKEIGHQFTFYTYGPFNYANKKNLEKIEKIADSLELIMRLDDKDLLLETIVEAKKKANTKIFLSKLWTSEDFSKKNEKYYPFIRHGFAADDFENFKSLSVLFKKNNLLDGVVFRIPRSFRPWKVMKDLKMICKKFKIDCSVHVQLAGLTAESVEVDDLSNANCIAETIVSAKEYSFQRVFFDTFVDHDRGYFVHNGFVDRRYNPRLTAMVFRHLYGILKKNNLLQRGVWKNVQGVGNLISFTNDGDICLILFPEKETELKTLNVSLNSITKKGSGWIVDLSNGIESKCGYAYSDQRIKFEKPFLISAPLFLKLIKD